MIQVEQHQSWSHTNPDRQANMITYTSTCLLLLMVGFMGEHYNQHPHLHDIAMLKGSIVLTYYYAGNSGKYGVQPSSSEL